MIKNFKAQWKDLKEQKKGDEPDAPKTTNALLVIKWTQEFGDHLDRIIGHRNIPLSYIVREEVTVPVHEPPLVPGHPYSEDHVSVEAELVDRESNTNVLYCDYNYLVYYKLKEDTFLTPYAASIKPFQRPSMARLHGWPSRAITPDKTSGKRN